MTTHSEQGGRANRFARQSGIEITQDFPRDYAELSVVTQPHGE